MSITIYPSLDYVVEMHGEVVDAVPEGLLVRIGDDSTEDGWTYGLVRKIVKPRVSGPLGWLQSRDRTTVK